MNDTQAAVYLTIILVGLIIYCAVLLGRHSQWFLGTCKKCGCKWWEDKIVRYNGVYSQGWHCKSCSHYSGRYTGTLHDYGGM